MLTFLKKLGQILLNVAGVATGIGPIISPFIGSSASKVITTGTNDLTSIAQLVVTVETAFAASGGTGVDKLKALIPLVQNIVKTSEVVSGKKIADDVLFTKGCQEIGQGMVDVLNSIHPDSAQHSN